MGEHLICTQEATGSNPVCSTKFFIIGSPIYWERPLKSVISFLDNHKLELRDKKIAIFIVCIAQMFGKPTERYIKIHYLRPLEKKVSNLIIESGIFKGWLKNPNFNEREKVKNWVRRLISS